MNTKNALKSVSCIFPAPRNWLLLFLWSSPFLVSCSSMPDGRGAPSQNFVTPDTRDFGEEVFNVFERQSALHPTYSKQRIQAFETIHKEWNVVSTFNQIFPETLLRDLNSFLIQMLPFYDDDTLPLVTRGVSSLLFDLSKEEDALSAILQLKEREGYFPTLQKSEDDFLNRFLAFPKHKELLTQISSWWINNDRLDNLHFKSDPSENDVSSRLLQSFGLWLQTQNYSKNKKDQTGLLVELAIQEDTRLDTRIGRKCILVMTPDGQPVLTDAGKQVTQTLPKPFGEPSTQGRGTCGEALNAQGLPLYEIKDLSKSILANLFIEVRKVIQSEFPLKNNKLPFPVNMLVGIKPLLSPIDPVVKGFSEKSPLIEVLKSSIQLLKAPKIYKGLELFKILMTKHESDLTAFLKLFDEITEIGKKYPNATTDSESTLLKELLPVLQDLAATPGFLLDLFTALQDKELTKSLGAGVAKLLSYTGLPTVDDIELIYKKDLSTIFKTKVDPSQGDVQSNISYFMGVLLLILELDKTPYYSALEVVGTQVPTELMEMRIDDLGQAVVKAVIEELSVWDMVYVGGKPINAFDTKSSDGKIKNTWKELLLPSLKAFGLSEKPTIEQFILFANRKLEFKSVELFPGAPVDIKLQPILGNSGNDLRTTTAPYAIAAQAAALLSDHGCALRPMIRIFFKHGKSPQFVTLLKVFAQHWATSKNQFTRKDGTPVFREPRVGISKLESFMADITENTKLFEQLATLSGIMTGISLSPENQETKEELLALNATQPILKTLFGSVGTTYESSLIGKIFRSLDTFSERLNTNEMKKSKEGFEDGIKTIFDLFLQTENFNGKTRFKNRTGVVLLEVAIDFIRNKILERGATGQWEVDVNNLQNSLITDLTNPLLPGLLDALDSITTDRKVVDTTGELLLYILPDHQKEPAHFGELLQLSSFVFSPIREEIKVPLARALGRIIEKRAVMVSQSMNFLSLSLPLDTKNVFLSLLKNATTVHAQKKDWKLMILWDIAKTFLRTTPNSSQELDKVDLKQILHQLSSFLVDEKNGMEKVYDIVKKRKGALSPTTTP